MSLIGNNVSSILPDTIYDESFNDNSPQYDGVADFLKRRFGTEEVTVRQLYGSGSKAGRKDDATASIVLNAAESRRFTIPGRTNIKVNGMDVIINFRGAFICSMCHGAGHLPV